MNTYTVSITVNATSPDHARSMFPGHMVTKVTAKRSTAPTTTLRTAGTGPDSTTDRPAGLDYLETVAYVRGYGKGCMVYVKKNGIPRGDDLRAATIERDWDRHPQAHKAGMRELAREHEARAAYRPGLAVERVA